MILPVILAGGTGSRLWPVSRESYPKPFMRLGSDRSLLQLAISRGLVASGSDQCFVVTNKEYYFLSRDELAATGAKGTYLLEPFGRNTAAAVALAALQVVASGKPDDILLVLAADHLIRDLDRFRAATQSAAALAAEGRLVLFGIQPTLPETGFGYIEMGDPIGSGNARSVLRFIEKPDAATAVTYLASQRFVWNSGMFCFRADAILAAFETHAPELLQAVKETFTKRTAVTDRLDFPAEEFARIPSISIDYAVMEHADNLAVVPCEFGWSDVGSWKAVSEQLTPDASGNTQIGHAILIDTQNSHFQSDGRVVAAVGVSDLVVVDTPDALLISHRDRTQEVRAVVDELKLRGHDSAKMHQTVARPWGTYTVLQEGPGFKIKRIEVKPHQSLSLQMHHQRSEHWVVVRGTARVTNGEQVFLIHANQSTYIPSQTRHRLENPTTEPLAMIEVQCGAYLGEDDIVRFSDIYERA